MDADLQDPPELIPILLDKAREGYDVVYSLRERRPESLPTRLATRLFYKVVGRTSSVEQPANAGPFCVMRRKVVEEIVSLPERNFFLPGLRAFVGFRQAGVPFDRPPRIGGEPRLGMRKRIQHGMDGVIAFSNLPLQISTWIGFTVAGLALALGMFFIICKLFTDIEMPLGYTSLISVLLFLGGVQLVTLGVVGQYVGRTYDEVKRRPRYVVEETLGSGSPHDEVPSESGAWTPI
jgi:glycosyltransferase involved in cell wall biosynthesis